MGFDPISLMLIAGTAMAAAGSIAAGEAQKQEGESAQANARVMAAEDLAQSQRQGFAQAEKGKQLSGRAAATAAGSGTSVASPTVSDVLGGLESRTATNVGTAIGTGQQKSAADIYAGNLAAKRGSAALTSSILGASGTVLSGLSKGANDLGWFDDSSDEVDV